MVAPAGTMSPGGSRRQPARLLLVDDDPVLLHALSGTLANRLGHYLLDTCDTGIRALECVATHHYDTIISDVNMPGMNGLEFLIQAKRVRPHTPVVLISGHADDAVIAQAIDARVDDFIVKPIQRDVFIRTIRHTLHLSRLRLLIERREANIKQARARHVAIVDKIHQSNEQWLSILRQKASNVDSVSLSGDPVMRLEQVQRDVDLFKRKSFRHLAILDAFLVDATRSQRQLSEELNMVQEALRRLASTRRQLKY
jgi:DNA-binding NtrC family response regulator